MQPELDKASPAVTEAVLHSLLRIWGLLRQVQEPYFAQFGISASQWGILRVLQRAADKGENRLRLTEMSRRLLVQPPSVTGVVDRLERQGLVKRLTSARDLRVRKLSLTPKGRALMARVLAGHEQRTRRLFAALPARDQANLLSLLQQLEGHLNLLHSETPEARPKPVASRPRRRAASLASR
jgi:DNA-binding MarR family transcriptional regulator